MVRDGGGLDIRWDGIKWGGGWRKEGRKIKGAWHGGRRILV
jgi:hypothetical protein